MLVVMGILSVGLLGLIIYFAVSSRSSKLLKRSALIALGVIVLAVAVCGIFILVGPSEKEAEVVLPVFLDSSPQVKNHNIVALLVFLATILIIVALIVFIPMRERRKKERMEEKFGKAPVFEDSDELAIGESDNKKEEDSFDIDF